MSESQYGIVTVTEEVRIYKPFEGRIIDNMPKLVAEGRKVISPKNLMVQRLSGLEGDKDFLTRNYVHTSLAVIPNPEGDEVKLCHNVPSIYGINAESKLKDGALKINQEFYDNAEGLTLTGSEVKKFSEKNYSQPKTREKVWEHFAEGDTKLSKEYKDFVCKKLNLSFDEVMGLWMPQTKGLRLLCVGSVDDDNRSYADCDYILGNYDSRLVGVRAPEAQVVARENLGAKVQAEPENKLIVAPTLDQMLAIVNSPDLNRQGMVEAITAKYQQQK
jgi:hypothetical protein